MELCPSMKRPLRRILARKNSNWKGLFAVKVTFWGRILTIDSAEEPSVFVNHLERGKKGSVAESVGRNVQF